LESLAKSREASFSRQFVLILQRQLLELKRSFLAVVFLGILGVFNGILYLNMFWKIMAEEESQDIKRN
jgi:hypothetical protein